MSTLPLNVDQLAECLRTSAAGYYPAEAATELLIAHASWLRRDDFVTGCVGYDHDGATPIAWTDWHTVPAFLARAAYSSSGARILRLAAELEGIDCGHPLVELLASLDDTNSALVLDAIAHALNITPGAGR